MKIKKSIDLERELEDTKGNLKILLRLLGKDFKNKEELPYISDHLLKLHEISRSRIEPYSTNAKYVYTSYLTLIRTASKLTYRNLKRELKKSF